jgi:curved DNA-binding protein CbpA
LGREQATVEKFQLIQTAHEVLSDPSKRATYDRTRGISIKTSTSARSATTTPATATPQTPKTRARTGATGFSKTTPKASKPAFGYFTTREPPSSGPRKPPATSGFTKTTRPQKPERPKHPAEAYFERFREQSNSNRDAYSSSRAHNRQRKEEAYKADGVKSPKREKPQQSRFGTTFEDDIPRYGSEEDTFFSFSSNGGSFRSAAGEQKEGIWSGRSTAYSHVFAGVKEDLRSPMKGTSTNFSTDGFSPRKNGFTANSNGTATTNGKTKTPEREPDPPIFSFTPGPAQRKTSGQRRQSKRPGTTPSVDPNKIPKTPPPVDERRFTSAFSRLNVDANKTKARVTPKKPEPKMNIDEWTQKFAGMNPFMSPETKTLSEDKNFWSSVPLKSTPQTAKSSKRPARSRKGGGLEDMGDLQRDLPKAQTKFGSPGPVPVFGAFNMDVPSPMTRPTFNFAATSPVNPVVPEPTTPFRAQQPTPQSTPSQPPPFTAFPQPAEPLFTQPFIQEPFLNPLIPPKLLIPSIAKPKEFSFSVPPPAEMQALAAEVQAYHTAYVMERVRFEEAWNKYETLVQFVFTSEAKVREYLDLKERLIKQRAEMETLHTLCLERWGSVAKFSGFTS